MHILGGNGNRTDLKVQLYRLQDPQKETIFENCVADVNIPVGEVFTSPVLEGPNGTLHVSKVYLHDLQYPGSGTYIFQRYDRRLSVREFPERSGEQGVYQGSYPVSPPDPSAGRICHRTNTTAYVAAKKYDMEDKMPILIAEKDGPPTLR